MKSAASGLYVICFLRVEVPQLKIRKPFEKTPQTDLEKCFQVIVDLSELTDFFLCADRIRDANKGRK